MNRRIVTAIIKICGEAVLFTLIAGIIIGILGYTNEWESSVPYSNAFFIAGCLLIVGGGFSRMLAGQDWDRFQRVDAESFRDMSPTERANFIVNASSSFHQVILGFLSGIMLILISVLVW